MKVKHTFLYFLLISNFLIFSTFLINKRGGFQNKNNLIASAVKTSPSSNSYMILQYENEGVLMNKETVILDSEGEKHYFYDIVKEYDYKALFVRFSHRDCSDCIIKIKEVIEKLDEGLERNIVFLSDNASFVSFLNSIKLLPEGVVPYTFDLEDDRFVTGNYLDIPIEGKGLPFCFTVNELFETDRLFIPDIEDLHTIRHYIQTILKSL